MKFLHRVEALGGRFLEELFQGKECNQEFSVTPQAAPPSLPWGSVLAQLFVSPAVNQPCRGSWNGEFGVLYFDVGLCGWAGAQAGLG